jgi:hypothetical protein
MFGNVEGIVLVSCGRRGCLGALLLEILLLHLLERHVPALPIVVTAFSLRHVCEAGCSWRVRSPAVSSGCLGGHGPVVLGTCSLLYDFSPVLR